MNKNSINKKYPNRFVVNNDQLRNLSLSLEGRLREVEPNAKLYIEPKLLETLLFDLDHFTSFFSNDFLRKLDLSEISLKNRDINGINLSGTNISINLKEISKNLALTNLSGLDLTNQHLDGFFLYNTNLSGTSVVINENTINPKSDLTTCQLDYCTVILKEYSRYSKENLQGNVMIYKSEMAYMLDQIKSAEAFIKPRVRK